MGKIQWCRVLWGGFLAGIIHNLGDFLFNGWLMADQWEAFMKRFQLPEMGAGTMVLFVGMDLALGLLGVWLYAAVRPRLGPGPKAALCVGIVLWALTWGWSNLSFSAMGFFTWAEGCLGMAWGLGQVVLATLVGAWAYKED